MIDINEQKEESIFDTLHQGKQISDEDLNNLCYIFNELLEASLCIQYEVEQEAEHQDNMNLKIYSKGFDNIIKECNKQYLEIKKQNQWDSNIGEKLI